MIIEYRKSVYRLVRILELLIEYERTLSIRDIALINDCTERTVYNDINNLVERWNHLLHLDISHTSLISQNTSIGNIQYVIEQIYVNEPITRLLKLVIEEPFQSIETYASTLELSQQVTRNLLADLKESLESYNLELFTRSRQICIRGDEFDVRYFCAVFYYQFEHSFKVEYQEVAYDMSIQEYLTQYSIISRFIKYIEFVSALRYAQKFTMNKERTVISLNADTNVMVLQFIDILRMHCQKLEAHKVEIMSIFSMMGYQIPMADINKVLSIISSILYMDNNIFYKHDSKVHVVNLFVKNYSKVHPSRYTQARQRFSTVLENFTDNQDQVLAGIIYVIDMLYPIELEPKRHTFVVYSDTSPEHAQSLKRQLEIYFPRHNFYVYLGKVEYRFPDKEELLQYCTMRNCSGIITTLSFPYKIQTPIISVSDYFVGTDVGRIFDFINATEN